MGSELLVLVSTETRTTPCSYIYKREAVMVSISLNAVTPSGLRQRSKQRELERLEKIGKERLEGTKRDLMQLARATYIRHIEECQGRQELESRWIIRNIDIRIWFRHYTKPKAQDEKVDEERTDEMETQIRVYSREIRETFVITYTHFATQKPKSSGWLLGCRLT
jgi:hypothetical protein